MPATLVVAYILFGIEGIGVKIKDPFGVDANDLPVDGICAKIERCVISNAGKAGPSPPASVVS
jgi:putative membrane protein